MGATAAIYGRVVNKNGLGLSGKAFTVYDVSAPGAPVSVGSGSTDANGYFSLTGLDDAKPYRVEVTTNATTALKAVKEAFSGQAKTLHIFDRLHVLSGGVAQFDGTVGFAQPVLVPAGAATAPGLAISGDPDTGLYSAGANFLGLSTAAASRFRIANDGRWGFPVEGVGAFGFIDGQETDETTLLVRAAPSQTADVFQVQNDALAILFGVAADGLSLRMDTLVTDQTPGSGTAGWIKVKWGPNGANTGYIQVKNPFGS